jgi:hypothetical protein
LLFIDMQHDGYAVDAMFFGLWLLPLGYLVHRSGRFPRVLGILLVGAGCGYLLDVCAVFLAPGISAGVARFIAVPAAAAGELTFMLWLLVKGVRVPATRVGRPP